MDAADQDRMVAAPGNAPRPALNRRHRILKAGRSKYALLSSQPNGEAGMARA